MRHLVALLLLIGPLGGVALAQAPRGIGDCERIRGDLAYNQCLAMFGPKAGVRGASAEAAADPEATAPAPAAQERRVGRRSRSGRVVTRGRQRASFTVGGGSRRSYRRGGRRR